MVLRSEALLCADSTPAPFGPRAPKYIGRSLARRGGAPVSAVSPRRTGPRGPNGVRRGGEKAPGRLPPGAGPVQRRGGTAVPSPCEGAVREGSRLK
jgi:hypothetical protein